MGGRFPHGISGVTVVLSWCYLGVTVMLQWRYRGGTMVLQVSFSGITVVLQWSKWRARRRVGVKQGRQLTRTRV
jgi:hypothetical protein